MQPYPLNDYFTGISLGSCSFRLSSVNRLTWEHFLSSMSTICGPSSPPRTWSWEGVRSAWGWRISWSEEKRCHSLYNWRRDSPPPWRTCHGSRACYSEPLAVPDSGTCPRIHIQNFLIKVMLVILVGWGVVFEGEQCSWCDWHVNFKYTALQGVMGSII